MTSLPIGNLSPLYLITDRKIANPALLVALEAALKGGVRMVQLREKDLAPVALKQLALSVLKLTRSYGAKLLLNGSPELAAEIGADGVHLGIHSTSVTSARQILGAHALIGYSAHSSHEIRTVSEQGASFFTFSPVYNTLSKAQYGPPQGLEALRQACAATALPVYALGGITRERVGAVLDAGAFGIALISAVLGSADPRKAVLSLLSELSINHCQH